MTAEITPIRTLQPEEGEYTERPFGNQARLLAVKDRLGFYPQTHTELSTTINLMGREGHPNPVLAHLNEIAIHQHKIHRKKQTDAAGSAETLRRIVHNFEDYAANAVNESHSVELFVDAVGSMQINPRRGFVSAFPTSDWRYDGNLRAAFTALTRQVETAEYAHSHPDAPSPLGDKKLIDMTTNEDRVVRIEDALKSYRVNDLLKLSEAVQESQENRLSFWIAQLEGAKSHIFARNVAVDALAHLREVRE